MTVRITHEATVERVAQLLASARTKGELGQILAEEITRYTLHDLQVVGGRLHAELVRLPRSYRDKVGPYMTDQILGGYHRFITSYRSGLFTTMKEPLADRENFIRFCAMIPEGCSRRDDTLQRLPVTFTTRHRLFYYLIAAYTMFILEEPGHPVGTPFPGGFNVENRNGTFYCLIRDHEKEVPYSICNFCPALQSDDDHQGQS
ncbi:MAG: DUF2115 domain-containing protein [Methanospirillum sp.]|nr:DUF2115 domain-containing protein [Methanospirillum sp.]